MAKFTLFLIHGIGMHRDSSWADDAIEMLSQAWQNTVGLDASFSDHLETVPIAYDEVFEGHLDDFADFSKGVYHDALDLTHHQRERLAATVALTTI